jgi:hypothetical protein
LQRGDPYEDEKIHGPFKDCLRQAKNEKNGVYIRRKLKEVDEMR